MGKQHKIQIISVEDTQDTDFTEKKTDRQELISWWKQDVLRNSRALIIGAGAIGNELLKNLALLGFGYVYICDMDHISMSNLSRTVLFSTNDVGQKKAVVAAERYLQMNVESEAVADSFVGDICATLGAGVFHHVDVVVGCLDNLQTRFEVSRRCNLLGIPYIDAGINELDWQLVNAHYPYSPCWGCSMSQKQADQAINRQRKSCDVTKKVNIATGHAPTVQVASAMVASLQAQEVIKYVTRTDWDRTHPNSDQDDPNLPPQPRFGEVVRFSGKRNEMMISPFGVRKTCYDHFTYDEVKETEIRADWTLAKVFEYVEKHFGKGYYLSLRGDSRYQKAAFVTTGQCRNCGKPIHIFKSQKVIEDKDLYCTDCPPVENTLSHAEEKITFRAGDDSEILALTLAEIGIPKMHIIEMYSEEDLSKVIALELTGDMPEIMPKLWKKEQVAK